jgi:hypothetical protein
MNKYNTASIMMSMITFGISILFNAGIILISLSAMFFGWNLAVAYMTYDIDKTIMKRFRHMMKEIRQEFEQEIENEIKRRGQKERK